jgi:hypothetical protein
VPIDHSLTLIMFTCVAFKKSLKVQITRADKEGRKTTNLSTFSLASK